MPDPDLMIATLQIQLGEDVSTGQLVEHIIDTRDRKPVLRPFMAGRTKHQEFT